MSKIYWASDSTVQFNGIETYPQTGMGQTLPLYLKRDVEIVNYAKNGRSTKSFITDGRLSKIKSEIGKGDFLFIQFGHNDEKESDPARFTKPFEDYKDNLYLYVNVAREAGAYPVFITSLERRCYESEHVLGPGNHGEYVSAMKEAAQELNVPLVDLYLASRAALEEAGASITESWYMHVPAGIYPYKPDGLQTDNTHLQYPGAVIFAGIIAKGLKDLGGIYAELIREEWDGISRLYCKPTNQ